MDSGSAVRLARTPFSLLLLELSIYYLNVVQRHVYARDACAVSPSRRMCVGQRGRGEITVRP